MIMELDNDPCVSCSLIRSRNMAWKTESYQKKPKGETGATVAANRPSYKATQVAENSPFQ